MNRQQLGQLLRVNQENDSTWMASLLELTSMWARGQTAEEARENWLKEYDQPLLYPLFASLLEERAKHPLITVEDAVEARTTPLQRPATVAFPAIRKRYRIQTNEGLPRRHIVLPDGRALVVCGWTGRVPSALADVRCSPEPVAPEIIAAQLDGVLAEEIPLPPGQTTHPMAILDFEGQRYAVDHRSNALVELPDGRLHRIEATYPEEPVRVATLIPFDPNHFYMPYQLEAFGKTPAIPVAADYPGMASEPRDLRIRFSLGGERFVLSHEACEQGKGIVFVPGHGFYRIGIYLQSMPVQLGELSPLPDGHYDPRNVAAALRLADAVDVEPPGSR